MSSDPVIRRAAAGDRQELVAMLDRTFASRDFSESFGERFPHLFSDDAIHQHHLVCSDGVIQSCVGCYAFPALLHGVALRVCGIGQVATIPEARGGGLMSRLLDTALAERGDCDLFWLHGERRRYARVGFAPGGCVVSGVVAAHLVRDAAGSGAAGTSRALDLRQDAALIARTLAAAPFSLVLERASQLRLLGGKQVHGLTDGEACILLDAPGRLVWAMHGPAPSVIRLIRHHLETRSLTPAASTPLTLQADPWDQLSLAVVRSLSGDTTTRATASLRIGRLLPLLQAWAAAHPPPPQASLRPWTIDGGAAGCVRIACAGRQWRIAEGTLPADVRLEGSELSELVFGFVPLGAWNLEVDQAARYLLPLQFAIPWGYGL